jgi:hypothetical protein
MADEQKQWEPWDVAKKWPFGSVVLLRRAKRGDALRYVLYEYWRPDDNANHIAWLEDHGIILAFMLIDTINSEESSNGTSGGRVERSGGESDSVVGSDRQP